MDDIDKHSLMQLLFLDEITQRNTDEKPTLKNLFDVTLKLIQEQRWKSQECQK